MIGKEPQVNRSTDSALGIINDPTISIPGHQVHEDTRSSLYGQIAEYALVAMVMVNLAIYEWVRFYIETPPHPMWITFFALSLVSYIGVRIGLLFPRLRALTRDREGRKRFQGVLEELADRGFYSFSNLQDDYGPIKGTVLVGPAGVFSIDTKTYSRTGRPFERVEQTDAMTVTIAGREALGSPVRQARNFGRRVRALLSAAELEPSLQPVLLFPGWKVGKVLSPTESEVWVVNEEMLGSYMRVLSPILEPGEVIALCEALENARVPSEET